MNADTEPHHSSSTSGVASDKAANQLGLDERLKLVDLIQALESVSTEAQFKSCMDGAMQAIFPHGMLVCGIGKLNGNGGVERSWLLFNHFPEDYVESLRQSDGSLKSPLIERWMRTRAPVLVELNHDDGSWPQDWLAKARSRGFDNFASHAFFDLAGSFVTNFCFAKIPGRLGPRHEHLLRLLVPHLHLALLRLHADVRERARPLGGRLLSARQREVLHWMHMGKTNGEIAKILQTSEANIKYHVKNIFIKLNVTNRTQAVARASDPDVFEA
jgi:transcriptional regulator EpsA